MGKDAGHSGLFIGVQTFLKKFLAAGGREDLGSLKPLGLFFSLRSLSCRAFVVF
jgi:hypothetical protein